MIALLMAMCLVKDKQKRDVENLHTERAMKFVEALKQFTPDLTDVLVTTGASLITYGCHRIWTPLGFLSAGAFLFTLGLLRLKGKS